MKKITIILSLLVSFISFSQKPKTYYFDENQNQIAKEEFDKRGDDWKTGFFKSYFVDQNDSSREIAMIFRALEKGTITKEKYKEAIDYINKITGAGIDEEYTIAICYFFKPVNMGNVVDFQSSQSSYKNFFSKKKKTFNIFMTEKGYHRDLKDVYEDKDGKIKDLFFKYPFDHGNYIAIRPDGSFQKRIEEYNYHEILDFIKNKN
jgi:hypothetical protein